MTLHVIENMSDPWSSTSMIKVTEYGDYYEFEFGAESITVAKIHFRTNPFWRVVRTNFESRDCVQCDCPVSMWERMRDEDPT